LARSGPSDVSSQIKINFSMVLNLLLSQTPAQAETLLEKSFATVTTRNGRREYQHLLNDFARHLDFLALTGYVDDEARLTRAGLWASQLRVDQPLLIAECLRRHVLPESDPALLAAVIAVFADDREWEAEVDDRRRFPGKLVRAFVEVQKTLKPLIRRMSRAKFPAKSLFLPPAGAMYAWATGRLWKSVVRESRIAEGDMVMLVLRTADNLRHIKRLADVFPGGAETAGRALDRILRAPVVVD
jgi:superfamily II RNA helicase